jgi:hypothetical protein
MDITIGNNMNMQEICGMLVRLRRHISEINWADVYLKEKSGKSTAPIDLHTSGHSRPGCLCVRRRRQLHGAFKSMEKNCVSN